MTTGRERDLDGGELRGRGAAVLVGLAGGTVVALVPGARRTASAVDRFLAYNRRAQGRVEGVGLDDQRRLPDVEAVALPAQAAALIQRDVVLRTE